MRYEYVSAPRELQMKIDYGYDDDANNIEPRIGFAWSSGTKDGWLGKVNWRAAATPRSAEATESFTDEYSSPYFRRVEHR